MEFYKNFYSYDANGNLDTLARFDRETVPHAFDALNYFYEKDQFGNPLRNRLYHHWDAGDDSFVTESVDGVADLPMLVTTFEDDHDLINTDNNYSYDAMGNLIRDVKENITLIDRTPTGKVDFVHRQDADPYMALDFRYDGTGQRVGKEVLEDDDGPLVKAEHYVRDAQGNIMGVYTYDLSGGPPARLTLANRPIYGSSRAGVDNEPVELMGVSYPAPLPSELFHIPGSKQYELTDHLGNVHVTISDVHLPMESATPDDEADYYLPQVLSAMDYEPFGSLLPGRNYSSDSYRFGFNGMEKDDEVHGSTGTSYDFGARMYDSRIGRWLAIDPQASRYADLSPYAFVANSPIIAIDPNGEEIVITGTIAFRTRVVSELQKLTDHRVRLKTDGTVVVRHRWFGPKSSKPFGTQLLAELARDKEHLVSVSETLSHTKTTPENERAAYLNGGLAGGSNSNIALNLDEQIAVIDEMYDGAEQPDQITVGRELLYARDFASGVAQPGLAMDETGVYNDPDAIDGSIPLSAQEYRVRMGGERSLRWEQNLLRRAEPKKSELRYKDPIDLQMEPMPNEDKSSPPIPKKQ